MSGDVVYQSSLAWNATRPATVIITCVDGRWYSHFQEFVRVRLDAGSETDFVAVPGGIEPLALMDLDPRDFEFLRHRLQALVDAHGTRRIVAIAHQDCAWYLARSPGPATNMRDLQIADLRRAAAVLREMFADVTVEIYYARLSDTPSKQVVFESIPTLL